MTVGKDDSWVRPHTHGTTWHLGVMCCWKTALGHTCTAIELLHLTPQFLLSQLAEHTTLYAHEYVSTCHRCLKLVSMIRQSFCLCSLSTQCYRVQCHAC